MISDIKSKPFFIPFVIGGILVAMSTGSALWILITDKSISTPQNEESNNILISPTVSEAAINVTNTTVIPNLIGQNITSSPNPTDIKSQTALTKIPAITSSIPKQYTSTPIPQGSKTIISSTSTPIPTTVFVPTHSPIPQFTNTPIPTQYKNGTYSVTGSYNTPAGLQQITIQLTISSDNVSAVSVTNQATDSESSNYENKFKSGIGAKVVGLPLNNATSISTINGASLTTNFFKQTVVGNIKTQAH